MKNMKDKNRKVEWKKHNQKTATEMSMNNFVATFPGYITSVKFDSITNKGRQC